MTTGQMTLIVRFGHGCCADITGGNIEFRSGLGVPPEFTGTLDEFATKYPAHIAELIERGAVKQS